MATFYHKLAKSLKRNEMKYGFAPLLVGLFFWRILLPMSAHADITSNLVGYWKFDDGTGHTAVDSSGNGYNGTLNNFASDDSEWITGQMNKALIFDGSSDYVDMGLKTNLELGSTGTISAWVHSGVTGNFRFIAGDANWDFDTNGYVLGFDNFGHAEFDIDDGSTSLSAISSSVHDDGKWHLFTGTWNGTTMTIYVDGISEGTASQTTNPVTNVNNFQVGKNAAGADYYMSGPVDDLRVYSRALSSSDVTQLYDLGVVPTVTAQAASSVGVTSAVLNGTITADGGLASTTVRGFAYGVSTAYGATTTESGTFNLGAFSASVSPISCGTTYHFAPYAVNTYGTSTYPADTTFTTGTCATPFQSTSTDFILLRDILSIAGGSPNYSLSSSTHFTELSAGSNAALGTSTATDYNADSSFLVALQSNSASLSFSVDSSTKDFGNVTPGLLYSASSTLTVTTTNSSGFNVTAANSGGAATMVSGSNTIPDKTAWSAGSTCSNAGNATASSTQLQTLQFRIQKAITDSADFCSAWWGTDDTTTNALFAGFPTSAQQIVNRSSAASSGTNAVVLYELEVPSSQSTGSYSGTITYTAVANP